MMKVEELKRPAPVEEAPLANVDRAEPEPGPGQLLVRVHVCGACHTDLHTVEGDIVPPSYPVVPGHQVVGEVAALGEGVTGWGVGQRVGVPWLHSACGHCAQCRAGRENLCAEARFTGFDVDGGYAGALLAEADYALYIPDAISDEQAAPMLCAGIVGYRSLRLADLKKGETLGLVGFGSSAHLCIQVARYWDCQVYVFTRSESHRALARQLGAAWAGGIEDNAPAPLDRAVIFAPAGRLVPPTLMKLRPGGTLAVNAIHMSPIPEMEYAVIYGERTLRSVANATRRDGREFLELAARIPVQAETRTYPLEQANEALLDMKASRIDGSAVLRP